MIALITLDLSEKIIKTYSEIDSFENLRQLEKELTQSVRVFNEDNHSEIFSNNRQLDGESKKPNEQEIVAIIKEEKPRINSMINATLGRIAASDLVNFLDENEQAIDLFYKRVNLLTYKGVWQANESSDYLDGKREGEIALKIEKLFNPALSSEKMYVTFRLLDGGVIDKWIIVKSLNFPFTNVTLTNTSLTQSFLSIVEFGEIFDANNIVISKRLFIHLILDCKSEFHFDWKDNTAQDPETINNFLGSFKSNCEGMNDVTFTLSLEEEDEDYYKVLIYSITVCTFALAQIFNTLWLTKQINSSNTLANSISLVTIVQNTVWNSYGCLCHFFLTVSYDVK